MSSDSNVMLLRPGSSTLFEEDDAGPTTRWRSTSRAKMVGYLLEPPGAAEAQEKVRPQPPSDIDWPLRKTSFTLPPSILLEAGQKVPCDVDSDETVSGSSTKPAPPNEKDKTHDEEKDKDKDNLNGASLVDSDVY